MVQGHLGWQYKFRQNRFEISTECKYLCKCTVSNLTISQRSLRLTVSFVFLG